MKPALKVQLQQRAEGGAAEEQRSVQLGAICGSLGDCHRRLGDSEAAVQKYRESVDHLQSCSQPSDEVGTPLAGAAAILRVGFCEHLSFYRYC